MNYFTAKKLTQTARLISSVFHPLFMPSIGLLIIFNTDSYINFTTATAIKLQVFLVIVVSTLIIPLLVSILLLNLKLIRSLEMELSRERILPYGVTILLYFSTLFFLREADQLPSIIYKFVTGAGLSVFLAFLINFKWKISAHMIGIGGLIGALIGVSLKLNTNVTNYIMVALFIAGLIGTARLFMKAHTPSQIYVGFLVGAACQIIAIYY